MEIFGNLNALLGPRYHVEHKGVTIWCSSAEAALSLVRLIHDEREREARAERFAESDRQARELEAAQDPGTRLLRVLESADRAVSVAEVVEELSLRSGRALGSVQRVLEDHLRPHGIPVDEVVVVVGTGQDSPAGRG